MVKESPTSESWLSAEMEETLDDLFENEFSEPMLSDELRKVYKEKQPSDLDRRTYYDNLLRLQIELIKLQDWVEATGSKVLIICEGRDSAGKGGVTGMPNSAMDAAGGGSCDEVQRRRGRARRRLQEGDIADVDVKVAQMKNVYASDADRTNSDLVQIEMGAGGSTVKVEGLEEPIVLEIKLEKPDPLLTACAPFVELPDGSKAPGYYREGDRCVACDESCATTDATSSNSTKEENVRHGKCLNSSQILKLDCNSSVVEFNCSLPQFVEFPPDELNPDGSNRTFYAPRVTGGGEPLAVTVTCPGRVPECKFWDANISDWAGDGCTVASYTNSSITCECTHLTDFAGATGDVGSTAGSVVEMGLALSLTDLLNALTVLITLLLALALFAALWALNQRAITGQKVGCLIMRSRGRSGHSPLSPSSVFFKGLCCSFVLE